MGVISQFIIQVRSVSVGTFGGSIFSGKDTATNKSVRCVASYKIITRTPEIGEFWNVTGRAVEHEEYGLQYHLSMCTITELPSPKFLSSLLVRHQQFRGFGLGKSKVKKLVEGVGSEIELIKILDQGHYLHIADLIAEPICKELCDRWIPLQNEMALARFLTEHNLPPFMHKQIVRICRENAVERLKNNPYMLLGFAPVSNRLWQTIETISENLEIPKDSPKRLTGAVEHILYTSLRSGDTAMLKEDLVEQALKLLANKAYAVKAIEYACKAKAICSFRNENENLYFQTTGAAQIESCVEKHVVNLSSAPIQMSLSSGNIGFIIDEYSRDFSKRNDMQLTYEQISAIHIAINNRVSILTGFGGTGKTTALQAVADVAEKLGSNVYLMALAGKAKDRLQKATGRSNECYTIHAFINKIRNSDPDKKHHIDLRLSTLIIVDEASMIDISLAKKLLDLLANSNANILFAGDPAQLSPVGFGLFFHTLIDKLPTQRLTLVHRQAAESTIHKMAMSVREGVPYSIPNWNGEVEGVYFVECGKKQKEIHQQVQYICKKINGQVITPHAAERAPDNANALNKMIQVILNPDILNMEGENTKPAVRMGDINIYIGDPIIVTNNNYDIGLYNGNTGVVTDIKIENEKQIIVTKFEQVTINLSKDQCFELGINLAYAITIHKSQGSEYESVIICCSNRSKLMERSMIYTALTRSKKLTNLRSA